MNELYDWIASRSDPDTAWSYVSRLDEACHRLDHFPNRGSPRDDLRKGLRTISFERRTVIAFIVQPTEVRIVRVLHGGRDLKHALEQE